MVQFGGGGQAAPPAPRRANGARVGGAAMGGERLSNEEIALLLRLAVRTVDFHVGHILEKLGVGSRLEAVVWAKTHGLIE